MNPYADLIQIKSIACDLPADFITAIVTVESSFNPWAARFEPAFLAAYVSAAVKHWEPCSNQTERILRATSFGLMQIMGEDAREFGYEDPFLTTLCEPETGLEYGCRQLAKMKTKYLDEFGWDGVIAAYNEGSPRKAADGTWGDQAYVDAVNKALTALRAT